MEVKLILHSQFSDNIDMKLRGKVCHDVRKTYADDIRGIDIEELKNDFRKNLSTRSTQVYGERLTKYQMKFLHQETGKMPVNLQKSFSK